MTEQEKQQLWIAAWRRAGPELERIRNEELRALTDDKATFNATFLGVSPPRRSTSTSGLVEFQAYMLKWRLKLEFAN